MQIRFFPIVSCEYVCQEKLLRISTNSIWTWATICTSLLNITFFTSMYCSSWPICCYSLSYTTRICVEIFSFKPAYWYSFCIVQLKCLFNTSSSISLTYAYITIAISLEKCKLGLLNKYNKSNDMLYIEATDHKIDLFPTQ